MSEGGRSWGERILVYSPIERDMQLRAGVVDRDRIEVIGMPRLDAVHHWREAHVGSAPQTAVLFASFLPEVGMPTLAKGVPITGADAPSSDMTVRTSEFVDGLPQHTSRDIAACC